jgi:hypothetical protein
MPSPEARLALLNEQQAAITHALTAMSSGRWTGEDSVEAWLLALNPTLNGQLSPRAPLYEPLASSGIPGASPVWIGSPNCWRGHGGFKPVAIVLHRMAGTLSACDAWFVQSAAQVSAHYGIGLQGQQHQYVALADSAWANGILEQGNTWPGPQGNPNYQTISIETDDNGSGTTPVTDAQYAATLQVANLAKQTYPSIQWLLRHTDISPRSRPDCCGARWVNSGRFKDLATKLSLKTTF